MMSTLSESLSPLLLPLPAWTTLLFFWMVLPLLQSPYLLGVAAMPPGQRPIRHGHGGNQRHHQEHHNQLPPLLQQPGSDRFELEQARVDAIKQDLLNKIGLARVPDVSRFNVSTEEMRTKLRLYRDSLENVQENTHTLFDEDQYMAKDFHEINFSDCHPAEDCRVSSHRDSYHFDLTTHIHQPEEANRETVLDSGKLRLFKTVVKPHNIRDKSISGNSARISVYLILHGDSKGQGYRRLLDSKMVSLGNSRVWESFDITAALRQWQADPTLNLGLDLICDTQSIGELLEFHTNTTTSEQGQTHHLVSTEKSFLPVVQFYTQTRQIVVAAANSQRQKRAAAATSKLDCEQGTGETLCCRYPLWVSFADIGWQDWVIAPEGYQAYYCDGSCPHSFKVAHNFAAVKSILYHANPAAAPAPCCSASKLSPLSILHFNEEGDLTVTEYEDMVVEQCKCS